MDWQLELVVVPVTDVDRAKRFYSEQVGFVVDHDSRFGDELRIVQLTPPGSACSIAVGTGIVATPPGSVEGMQLVVPDIEAARAELVQGVWRSAGSSTTTAPCGWMAGVETGTRSSSSAIPTATAGSCRNAPPAGRSADRVTQSTAAHRDPPAPAPRWVRLKAPGRWPLGRGAGSP